MGYLDRLAWNRRSGPAPAEVEQEGSGTWLGFASRFVDLDDDELVVAAPGYDASRAGRVDVLER